MFKNLHSRVMAMITAELRRSIWPYLWCPRSSHNSKRTCAIHL